MLVDAGWPLDRIGAISIVGGGTAAVLASLGSGALVTHLGRRPALVAFGLLQVAALALAGALGYPRMLGLSVVLGSAGVAAAAWLFHQPSAPSPQVEAAQRST